MSRRGGSAALSFAGAALIGLVGGWFLARSHDRLHRNALFSGSAWRRFSALGWLERHGTADAIPVLRDYLAWEQRPTLRVRAQRVIDSLVGGAT